ncbi:AadA family aminoglycoside 3''-O-nucleotidyltransferase [Cupriavidus pauculus]|uniref:AadA family aminoglycoside 3''-O-nucleotidyltransferase n=1 Tax=Cupriavidus pauculus TaxID=82633 RepID=UPI003857D439
MFIPREIAEQCLLACAAIARHLGATLASTHLFGSALDGGLKPASDIDLLVIASERPDEPARQALMRDLLTISAPPGSDARLRALEVTVVARDEIVPWRYPARRELQFGEWLRTDLLAGIFEPPTTDHDLAILLTKVRRHSVALIGASAASILDPIPPKDFTAALRDTVAQWNSEADWDGDERNVILALARIWYSAATGEIAPKDVAADWVLERVPLGYRQVLMDARAGYLGVEQAGMVVSGEDVAGFVRFVRGVVEGRLVGEVGDV